MSFVGGNASLRKTLSRAKTYLCDLAAVASPRSPRSEKDDNIGLLGFSLRFNHFLQGHATLGPVPVLLDDGTYDRTPGRELALKTQGVVMIVWQIASFGIVAQSRDGVAAHLVYIPVVIEENVERNRNGGLNLPWERLLQHGLEALSGAKQNNVEFQLHDPAWQNLGKNLLVPPKSFSLKMAILQGQKVTKVLEKLSKVL